MALSVAACACYEWRPFTPAIPPPPREVAQADSLAPGPGELAASLRAPDGQTTVPGARAHLRPLAGDAGWRNVPVDALTGRLRILDLPVGSYELRTLALGYGPRLDTLHVTEGQGMAVVLRLPRSPTIAPAMIRVRKPWWKLW